MLHSMQIVLVLSLLFSCGLTSTAGKFQASNDNDDDYLSQKEHVLEKSYHGLIRENETLVEITPLIKVDEEKICDFRILKKPYHEIPFQIELVNNLGILKARRQLNCEKRKSYHFEIVAIFCDGTHSASANVHIAVIDINEYAPIFLQPSYVTEVDEGRLYKEIIRVEAADKDCTPLFGDVCKYEILNNDQPFKIDNEGSIKNTEPLSHKISHNHILSVVAYDCAMKESAPIMVSIKVRKVCEPRLYGIPERIDYTTVSTETLSLFPNAHIELCDMYCNGEGIRIRTTIALKTKHISFGCDRDISNCLQSTERPVIDLLPRGTEWTKDLSYDEGFEPVFHFDGSSGVIVPDNLVPRHDFAIRPFSIITKFRHYSPPSANKHAKEHIICSADDHKMNRHHMALFVRNCRLILLLRKNFNEGDLNIFSPAEWRWKIPEVCDNEWHHYVLNIDQSSTVELYIDGMKFYNSIGDRHSNPEVIDDWPLHAAHGVNTTLTVGACYQSSESRLKHTFNGDISEIKLSMNNILTKDEVKCGTKCAEHLVPPPERMIDNYQQIQSNYQMNEITIEGLKKSNIEMLLRKIQYVNTKHNPTIGRRNIEIRTAVMCINQSAVRLPTVETYIMVNEPINMIGNDGNVGGSAIVNAVATNDNGEMLSIKDEKQQQQQQQLSPSASLNSIEIEDFSKHDAILSEQEKAKIIITGDSNNLVSYTEIKQGVHILDNINITVIGGGGHLLAQNLQSLDSCSVIVFPSLNPDHEEIQIDGDETLSSTLDIKTNINKDGVEMIGYDSTNNYLDVLKALVYSNKKPAYYLNRVFKLSCSQLNSQFKSAEFTLTLTVLHPKQVITTTSPVAAAGIGIGATGGIVATNEISNSNGMNYAVQQQQQQQHVQQQQQGQGQPQQQFDSNMFAHAMIHSHDTQEPKSRVHTIVHNAQNSHPTMLIILICVFFVILLGGVSIARFRNSNQKFIDQNQACPKIADESLVWDDCALTITINPMQNDVVSEESSDSDNSDSDDEEVVNSSKYLNVSQLEWDNSTM